MVKQHLLTTQEVADSLKVNIMTIYRYIKAGKIKAHKIGKAFRVSGVELDRFLNSVATVRKN
jgi:excisionase family DNA binding protein